VLIFGRRDRRRAPVSRVLAALLLAAAALPAFSAELWVLVDADNNPASGCSVTTPAGALPGIEQRFVTTVNTTVSPPVVTGVTREDCANPGTGAFSAPVLISSGGWNVGVGNGTAGDNVIETSLPRPPGSVVVRLGFVYVDPAIGSDGLIAAAGGGPIFITAAALADDVARVPTLSSAMLALLAVLLGGVAYAYLRRNGIPVGPLAVVVLVLATTMAWAAIVLDGLTNDWVGFPPIASDPTGDSANGSDISAAFAKIEGATLFVRVDTQTGLPPSAVADNYTANTGVTTPISAATGLLANDTRGTPAATVSFYGGGTLGGAVTGHAAGTTTTFGAGGSITLNADGSMSFTPVAGFTGNFTFSYRISNINGTSDATVTIAAREPPAFTSTNATIFTVGTTGSFAVTASGSPAPTLAITSGTLPTGVSFNSATGVLSGPPGPGAAGTYPLTFTATNGVSPNATQSFTLTVNQGVAITSANTTTFTAGTAGSFTITTTGTPAAGTIGITGALPGGVGFTNNGDGTATIAGMPGALTGGTYPLTITASNTVGAPATQSFTLTVNQPPAITSLATATFLTGTAGTFAVTTTGFPRPAIVRQSGAMPPGLTLTDNGNGTATIASIATLAGSYPIVLSASNGVGVAATQTLTITVNQAPLITSANTTTFTVGTLGGFTITTSATPVAGTINLTGALPPNVLFTNNGNGTATLTGTPSALTGGTYPLTITASNGVGSPGVQAFTLIVNEAPAFTSTNSATFLVGTLGTFPVTTTGFPNATLSFAGTLPANVTFTNNGNGTATLTGTPASGTGGTYPIVITASNGVLPNAVQNPFALTVNQAPVANADSYSTVHDTPFTIAAPGILGNDTGVPFPTLVSVTGSGAPCTVFPCTVATAHGNLSVSANGGFGYLPAPNFAGSDGFTYLVGNVVAQSTAAVSITVTNVAPVVDLNGPPAGIGFGPASFTEGAGPVAIVDPAQLTVTDADSTQLASATIVLTNLLDAGAETVTVVCPDLSPGCSGAILAADVVSTPAAGTFTLAITRVAPLADYQALLRTLRYNNSSVNPTTTPDRDITVTVNDRIADNAPVAHAAVTVTADNNAPTITAPMSVTTPTNTARIFAGTISVADVDAGTSDVQVTLTSTNGTATLSGTAGLVVTGNASASVTSTGPLTSQNAALNNMTFTPTTAFAGAASLKIDIDDLGHTGSGGPKTATRTVAITVDALPTVTSTIPLNGATSVPTTASITVNFSEPVNATTASFQLECPVGTPKTFVLSASPSASFVLAPTSALPQGTTCQLTVVAAQVTDSVAQNLSANYVTSFTTNTLPTVTSTVPINAASGVSAGTTITVNFSEAVNAAIGSFSLQCPTGTPKTFTLSASPSASFVLTPSASLPPGTTCTVTVVAAQVTDVDAAQNMSANFAFSFSVAQAPTITSANNTTFLPNTAGTFTIVTIGTPTVTSITETGALPTGLLFSYTSGPNATISGSTSAVGTYPLTINATNGVAPDAVQSFTLNVACPVIAVSPATLPNAFAGDPYGPITFSATGGSGSYTFTLGAGAPPGLTFTGASLGGTPTDVGTFTFTVTATDTVTGCTGLRSFVNVQLDLIANNDVIGNVIGNVLVNSAAAGFSVTTNDQFPAGATITAFDAASVHGGAVSMTTSGPNLGQFSYNPPRGYQGPDSFTYTLSKNGRNSTATVSFTVSGMAWFIDNASSCTVCDGRLTNPYKLLADFNSANTGLPLAPQNNDTIFVYIGASLGTPYTGTTTLRQGQRLIGQGAVASLATLGGLTPGMGQTLPTTGGTNPNINAPITFVSSNSLQGFDMDGAAAQLTGNTATNFVVSLGRFRRSASNTGIQLIGGPNSGTFTFRSVSVSGGAGIGNNGVVIQNLAGSFNVLGLDSLTPNGGTISGFGGHGMTFTNVATCPSVGSCGGTAVVLNHMNVSGNGISQSNAPNTATCDGSFTTGNNTGCTANLNLQNVEGVAILDSKFNTGGQMGINGNNVYAFSLDGNSQVQSNGNEPLESGILFLNLHGTSAIRNSAVNNNAASQVVVAMTNAGASALSLSVANINFLNAAGGANRRSGLVLKGAAPGTTTLNISGSQFTENGGASGTGAVELTAGTPTAPLNLNGQIDTSTLRNSLNGVNLTVNSSSNVAFHTVNNTMFTGIGSAAIAYETLAGATGTVQGRITGNTIGDVLTAGSACQAATNCIGMWLQHSGGPSNTSALQLTVSGNTIQEIRGSYGISLVGNGGGSAHTLVSNNVLRNPRGDATQLEAIDVNYATSTPSTLTVCSDVRNNTISSAGSVSPWGAWLIPLISSQIDIHLRQRNTVNVRLPGYGGGAQDPAAVQAFVTGNNGGATSLAEVDLTATGFLGGAACTTP
jgi:large repetitive protein